MRPPLPDKALLDMAYDAVRRTPDNSVCLDALAYVFAVWSAQMQVWLTERRLELARATMNEGDAA